LKDLYLKGTTIVARYENDRDALTELDTHWESCECDDTLDQAEDFFAEVLATLEQFRTSIEFDIKTEQPQMSASIIEQSSNLEKVKLTSNTNQITSVHTGIPPASPESEAIDLLFNFNMEASTKSMPKTSIHVANNNIEPKNNNGERVQLLSSVNNSVQSKQENQLIDFLGPHNNNEVLNYNGQTPINNLMCTDNQAEVHNGSMTLTPQHPNGANINPFINQPFNPFANN
jgi:hypothetical protein